MIPVNIITGFLGSGKTTLLREVLRCDEFADAAVIVNEFGEVGLDHILIEEVEEGVLLLENGCVCCTIRSDLKETIRSLQSRVAAGQIAAFRRVFLETTGLADPTPIISTVLGEPIIRRHFRVGNTVCTVDAMAGPATLTAQPESIKQIAVADRILITKSDLVDDRQAASIKREVARINPVATISLTSGTGFDTAALFARDIGDDGERAAEIHRWIGNAEGMSDHLHDHPDGTACAFMIELGERINWTAFGVWLTALLHAHGERILRVKGLLNVSESQTPVVVHGVQHMVYPPLHMSRWPDADRSSRLVFITRGISRQDVEASLLAFLELANRTGGADPSCVTRSAV